MCFFLAGRATGHSVEGRETSCKVLFIFVTFFLTGNVCSCTSFISYLMCCARTHARAMPPARIFTWINLQAVLCSGCPTLLLLSFAKYLPYIATATPRGTLLVRPFALIHIRKVARWCPTCSPTCMLDHKSAILCANPLTTVAADSCDSLKSRLQVGRPVHESPYHGGSRLVRLVKSKEKKGSPFFLLNLTSRTSRLPPW